MSEITTTMQAEINAYAAELQRFCEERNIPTNSDWFSEPDHIAFKAADTKDFDKLIESFKPLSSEISCIEMDERRLATARLISGLKVGEFGKVYVVELMEPRPEKVGNDVVGLEHMEFLYPFFSRVESTLELAGVRTQRQGNSGHNWVNVVINPAGQEVKFNDKLLSETVAEEVERGETEVIYENKDS